MKIERFQEESKAHCDITKCLEATEPWPTRSNGVFQSTSVTHLFNLNKWFYCIALLVGCGCFSWMDGLFLLLHSVRPNSRNDELGVHKSETKYNMYLSIVGVLIPLPNTSAR